MNEIMQNPEFLTYVSYVVLGGLTVWVIAHVMKIFDSLWQPGPKEWVKKAGHVREELEDDLVELRRLQKSLQKVEKEISWNGDLKVRASKAMDVARDIRSKKKNDKEAQGVLLSAYPGCETKEEALVSEVQSAESDEVARDLVLLKAAGCTHRAEDVEEALNPAIERKQKKKQNGLRRKISTHLEQGPWEKLSSWLEKRSEKLDPGILRIVRSAEAELPVSIESDKEAPLLASLMSRESAPWKMRFGVPAMAAPAAGAAPTMSGTMEFLGDYSSSIEEGSEVPSMSGLNDALFTTWVGCTLTVVSVVLLAVVVNRIQGHWAKRRDSAFTILQDYCEWKKIARKMNPGVSNV